MDIDLRSAQTFENYGHCKFTSFDIEKASASHPNVGFLSTEDIYDLKTMVKAMLPTELIFDSYIAGGCFTRQKDNCFKTVSDVDIFIENQSPPSDILIKIINKVSKDTVRFSSIQHHSIAFTIGSMNFNVIGVLSTY